MRFGVFMLSALLVAGESRAATPLSESAFLDVASRDVRLRAILDEPLEIARAERARATALRGPEAAFDREALNGQPRQDTWSLSWAVPLDGRYWLQDRTARAALSAAESSHEGSRLAQRADLREAFATWALALDGAMVTGQLAEMIDRLERRAAAQAASGEASALSARRLFLARVEVRAEAARWMAQLAHARGRARAWLPELAADATPTRPTLPPVPADTSLWSSSPHLAAIGHAQRQAEASARLAGRFWALPELSVGRQIVRNERTDLGGPVFGIRWQLPLFDRGQGDRIEARARLGAVRARRELARSRIREEFAAALTAYSALRESAELSSGAGPAGTRVITSAAAMFEAGESDVTDLLETLRGVLSGQLAALESYAAALRAHRELELAAGRPLPLTEGDDR